MCCVPEAAAHSLLPTKAVASNSLMQASSPASQQTSRSRARLFTGGLHGHSMHVCGYRAPRKQRAAAQGSNTRSADKHAPKPAATSRPGAYHTRLPKAQEPPTQTLQHISDWLPLVSGGSTGTITAKPSLQRSRTDSSRTGPVPPKQTLSSNA